MRKSGYKILTIIYLAQELGLKTMARTVVLELLAFDNSQQRLARLLAARLIEVKKGRAQKDDLLSLSYLGKNKLLRRFPRLNFLKRNQIPDLTDTDKDPGSVSLGSAELTLVIFNVPESQRKRRDGLRYQLELLGFGRINRSLYLSPHLTVRESRQIWEAMSPRLVKDTTEGSILVLPIDRRTFSSLEDLPERVKAWWKLEAVAEEYERALAAWQVSQSRAKFLNHFISGLFLDPLLPSYLLGPDFPGRQVWPLAKKIILLTG